MAIFHMTAKVISRGKGQSAIAAAAYRSGERLKDREADEVKHYTSRQDRIITAGIMRPGDTPEHFQNREELWNAVEGFEKRRDAQLAREIEMALPHELTDQQREFLVKDFVREQFVRRGYIVDYAIHAPDADSDRRNHHAHLMITMRTCDREGFAATKDRSLNNIDQLATWRENWAALANRHLERHGHDARIDHRSLKAQGIEREPQIHVGVAAQAMSERGEIFESVAAKVNNAYSPEQRTVDYPGIDAGRSRAEHNAAIIERNAERERAQSAPAPIVDHWTDRAGMEAQQTAAAHAAARVKEQREKEAATQAQAQKEKQAKQEQQEKKDARQPAPEKAPEKTQADTRQQQGAQGRPRDTPEPPSPAPPPPVVEVTRPPRVQPEFARETVRQPEPPRPTPPPTQDQKAARLFAYDTENARREQQINERVGVSSRPAQEKQHEAKPTERGEKTDGKQGTAQKEMTDAQQRLAAVDAQQEKLAQMLLERGYGRDPGLGKGGGRER